MAPVLAYWDIRGLAQAIRLLLAYVEEEYEDKMYVCGPAPEFDKSCWFDIKHSLGLDFPNLPYYIDGDIKITQSNAILKHIARKHKVGGDSLQEMALADVLGDQAMDWRNGWVTLCYRTFHEAQEAYKEKLAGRLKQFEAFLGDKKFFTGDNLCFADFHMYELMDQHCMWWQQCLDGYPKLQAFKKRFEEIPQIKSYISSPKFMKFPINNKMAAFTGDK